MGGDEGGPRAGPARDRAHPAHGLRPRRPCSASSAPRRSTGAAPGSRWRSRAPALAAAGVAASGTPEQIARWVPECFGIGDEIKLGAYAVTEPQAGSDVKSLRTTARRDGDEWVLNGTKVFITNGGIADVHVVVATAPRARPPRPGLVRRREGHPGPAPGQEGVEDRHPRLAHRRGRPRGLPDPGGEPARRDGEARAQARARPPRRGLAAAPTRSPPSSSPGRSSAPRRSASPRPRTSGRS